MIDLRIRPEASQARQGERGDEAALTLTLRAAHHRVMTILPGLTSTRKDRIPAFLEDLRRLRVQTIALFPTCLSSEERASLYRDLEQIPGLRIPHVHLRSDCDAAEADYLVDRFGAEAFNIHPRASTHPFGAIPSRHASRFFVENVDLPPEYAEIAGADGEGRALGGLCPDFSHLENARLQGRTAYVATMTDLFGRCAIGCCHLSTIRVGDPNEWSGEWDHHDFVALSDFDYLARYRDRLPAKWASLELENSLEDQLKAASYLDRLLA